MGKHLRVAGRVAMDRARQGRSEKISKSEAECSVEDGQRMRGELAGCAASCFAAIEYLEKFAEGFDEDESQSLDL